MSNGNPRDGFFHPILTLIIDPNTCNITKKNAEPLCIKLGELEYA